MKTMMIKIDRCEISIEQINNGWILRCEGESRAVPAAGSARNLEESREVDTAEFVSSLDEIERRVQSELQASFTELKIPF